MALLSSATQRLMGLDWRDWVDSFSLMSLELLFYVKLGQCLIGVFFQKEQIRQAFETDDSHETSYFFFENQERCRKLYLLLRS